MSEAPEIAGGLIEFLHVTSPTWATKLTRERLGVLAIITRVEAERDALRAVVDAHKELYEAVEKDECSATYCAGQRGGMVHNAWYSVRDKLAALNAGEVES